MVKDFRMFHFWIVAMISFFMVTNSFAQDDKVTIENTVAAYLKAVEQKDNQQLLEFIYPKLFEKFPKEKMLAAMNEMKEDTSTTTTIEKTIIKNISKIVEFDGLKYALLSYSFNLNVVFNSTNADSLNQEDEDFDEAEFAYEMMIEKYGANNVVFNKQNHSLSAKANNSMYCIYNPKFMGWKFLENKESMASILKSIVPAKVRNQLTYKAPKSK